MSEAWFNPKCEPYFLCENIKYHIVLPQFARKKHASKKLPVKLGHCLLSECLIWTSEAIEPERTASRPFASSSRSKSKWWPSKKDVRAQKWQRESNSVQGSNSMLNCSSTGNGIPCVLKWKGFHFEPSCIIYHSLSEELKVQKTSQRFSRVPLECPHWELWNEHPLDMSGLTPQIPFMASPGSD